MSAFRKLRALVLISGLPTGGAERVTVRFLRSLRSRSLRSREAETVLCTVTDRLDGAPAEAAARAGIPRRDLGARRLLDPGAFARLVRLLREERIDVVHAHGQDASVLAAAARLVRPSALVVTRHVLDEPATTHRERVRARLAVAAARRADAVVAVSAAVEERLEELAPGIASRVHVIPNGIDIDAFAPAGAAVREALRSSLGLEDGHRAVLVPAVLRRGKGHGLLLDALPEIRRRVPEARILLAGSGEREDELRRRVREEGFGRAVSFLGFRDDVPDLMAASELVVLPSSAEALPTALLEAGAAARPVVATRVGGTPEVVEDGRTGLLVPPGDPAALADAVAGLLSDPERARSYGRAARDRVEERFAIERQIERTVDLWRRAAAGRPAEEGS